jgi:hypothetical protein
VKIRRLESGSNGTILATLRLDAGEELQVVFTTSQCAGITVANPDQPIFERENLDAASVREVIAAVTAFARVAVHAASDPPDF